MPAEGLVFSADETIATLQMSSVPIIDQPRWPAMDAKTHSGIPGFQIGL